MFDHLPALSTLHCVFIQHLSLLSRYEQMFDRLATPTNKACTAGKKQPKRTTKHRSFSDNIRTAECRVYVTGQIDFKLTFSAYSMLNINSLCFLTLIINN